ncbi:MAG TPA: hypothetical protein VMH24_04490 [Candidatus Sulfotelmatobacter sp.]|nr:hypothetical protein [Candidatus Sulfotelmatobacter sp.]
MNRDWRVAALVLAAVVLSACSGGVATSPAASPGGGGGGNPTSTATAAPSTGGGGGGSGGGSASDPCSLLTSDQISAAVGQPFGAGDTGGDIHMCTWIHPDANGLPLDQVIVTVNEDTGLCDEGSNAALGITNTPVDGVGDKACVGSLTGLPPVLTFYKGSGRGYSVTASGKDVPLASAPGVETVLATEIVANL